MYCIAVTQKGYPCTNQRKAKGCYCGVHQPKKKKYEECSICYHDMQRKVDLECGHSFCLSCLQKWRKPTCPICRQCTNMEITKDIHLKMSFIHKTLHEMPDTIGKSKKIVKAHSIMSTALSIHSFLFDKNNGTFRENFEMKATELYECGMNTLKYKKALESYDSRIKQLEE